MPNAAKALINDLDILLENTLTGNTWRPWVLNSFPHPDSLLKPAERERDSLNNIEQITLDNPDAGVYRFRVNGFSVNGHQEFHLAYQFDSTDHFEWQSPTSLDFITAGAQNTIRWNSTMQSNAGILEYSTDKGSSWQKIDDNADLSAGYFQWITPDVIEQALLRITIGTTSFISDTFTISTRTLTDVGFNCPDSLLFFWQKLPGIEYYRVYTLGNRYLDTITVTADSLIVLNKTSFPSLHYAVAPLIDGKEGMRSFTFDYTLQGVECYIRSFLGILDNNTAILSLSLGTLYGINAIVLEKFSGGRYLPFETINQPGNLQNNFTDTKLANGLNIYRAKLELAGGKIIYSQPETVYYFSGNSFIIFPNPVTQGQPLEILTNTNIISDITLLIYDSYGRKIIQKTLNNYQEKIPTDKLPKGLYFFRFIVDGEKDTILRVVVQ
jgi:Secretion system C-terminal sorting domain